MHLYHLLLCFIFYFYLLFPTFFFCLLLSGLIFLYFLFSSTGLRVFLLYNGFFFSALLRYNWQCCDTFKVYNVMIFNIFYTVKESTIELINTPLTSCMTLDVLTFKQCRDFLRSPVVKTLPSSAGGLGSIPGLGTKIPHTAWCGQKKWHNMLFSYSPVSNFATPWTASRQPSLSFTISQSLLKLMSFFTLIKSLYSSSLLLW